MTRLLSVIVPCMGQLRDLWVSAPPLLADESVEYILVDCNCPEWCGNFARAYWPIAKVVEVAQVGHFNRGDAYNVGARAASGKWLAFLDPVRVVAKRFTSGVRALLSEDVLLTTSPANGSSCTSTDEDPEVLICSAAAFARAGGYDPQLASWHGQARDLQERLREAIHRAPPEPSEAQELVEETLTIMRTSLQQLARRDRQAYTLLHMHVCKGVSVRELAALQGMSRSAVARSLTRAKATLRTVYQTTLLAQQSQGAQR